jgi:hypothetical protein
VTDRPYSRVYHGIVDDPAFAGVYDDNDALAEWLRMLLIADAMYPTSAPMPRRNRAVTLLIACGLVLERPGNRYTIRGLEAERERRSASARNAAAVRWHSKGNAEAMPKRDETSTDKTSNGADAHIPGTFLGFRPKVDANAADVKRQQDQFWDNCAKCGVQGRKHPAGGDHQFEVAA